MPRRTGAGHAADVIDLPTGRMRTAPVRSPIALDFGCHFDLEPFGSRSSENRYVSK